MSPQPPPPPPDPLIHETVGDIFTAPSNSILLHACNTRGSWGAGVAAAFKSRYPNAYEKYHAHCTTPPNIPPPPTKSPPNTQRAAAPLKTHQLGLLGSCLLIPPSEDDKDEKGGEEGGEGGEKGQGKNGGGGKKHYIACLFTSHNYGRNKDSQENILKATKTAMEDLKRQIQGIKEGKEGDGGGGGGERVGGEMNGGIETPTLPGDIWAVRINSGLFGVEWERTKGVLEGVGVGMWVVRPKDEKKRGQEGEVEGEGEVVEGGEGRGKRKRGGGIGGGVQGRRVAPKKQQGGLDGWLK